MRGGLHWILGALALIAGTFSASAQDTLQAILDRGFVENWYVIGPFDGPTDRDIVTRVAAGDVPLDDTDHLQIVGGLGGARPQAGATVPYEGEDRGWQQAAVPEASLDLAPLFEGRDQGVAYLAFYAEAAARTMVFFDLQTPLGARMTVNGIPVRNVRAGALETLGVERFIAAFRAGTNVVAMAVPLAGFDTLADALALTPREFNSRVLRNRTDLRGRSGFEISLELAPVEQLEEVYYVPRVEPRNTFSGIQGDVRQDAVVTFFNGSTEASPTVSVLLRSPYLRTPEPYTVPAIAPGSLEELVISVPLGTVPAGAEVSFTLDLSEGDVTETLNASITAADREQGGRVYVVTGQYLAEEPASLAGRVRTRTTAIRDQLRLLEDESEYGFHLGAVSDWLPVIHADPSLRKALLNAVASGLGGTHAGYARPDPRVVGGATLARDFALGQSMSEAFLRESMPSWLAWDIPGLPWRLPALLEEFALGGTVTNLPAAGLPALGRLLDANARPAILRRKEASPFPPTVDALRRLVSLQRQEVLDMGITTDVIVLENPAMPPEPLFMGSTAEMARSFPSIRVRGNGVASLTRAAEDGDVPAVGLYLNHLFPGDLTALSESKQVLGEAEHALLASERLASLAGLLSAPYPHDTLDHAWRQLVFWSSLDRFTRPEGANAYLDMLAGLREVFVSAETVGETARAALVAQVDTDRRSVALPQDAVPLVVFNPSSWARTDVCTVELPESYEAFALQDQVGDEVAFHVQDSPGLSGGPVLRFVAVGVPGLGQRTYYLVPGAVPPAPVVTSDPLLENDRFLVELDPRTGDIARFVDKRSGANYAGGALNRVLALGQDRSRRNDGRDFWTNGRLREVEGPPTRVTRTLYDKAQKLEVASRFAGGRVTRTLWAYDGVDRVDARIVLDGVSAADDLIGLTFAAPEPGAAVVFGERFGRTVGARNGDALVLRTKPLENVAGTATYAAHGFASMSPGDHLRVGMDRVLTLGPSIVVHGEGLASAATQVQRAFVAREMASQVVSHRDAAAQPLWSDRTFTVSHRKAGDIPTSLRILVGGPEDNTVTAEFLATLPDSAVTLFYERLSSGVALLVAPETEDGEYPNATLLIGGATADQSALLARELAEAIETRGSYNIAPSQYIAGAGRVDVLTSAPVTGLGILYAGTRMATADPDGGILIGLHEDSDRAGTYRPRKVSFDYALFPHDTSWREARLNREAGALAEPLQATRGAIHRGPLPGSGKLLSYNSEGFLLSSLRPVGEVATLSGVPGMPRDGLVAWGFDGRALPSRLAVSGLGGVQRASRADWAGNPQIPLRESGDEWEADFAAGVIQPVWLLANTGNLRTNPPGDVSGAPAESITVPLSTTYWREGRGVAPPGGVPLALQLEGTLGPDTSAITLVAANLQNTGRLEGTIALEAAEGMSIGPVTVPYVLGPGEVLRESIAILQTGPSTAEMAVAAQGRVNGRDYRAVLSANMQPLDVEVDYTEAQLRVRLRNASGLAATGMVDLIVPPAFWPERVGVWGRMEETDALVTPASRGVNVPAYGVQTLYFRVGGASADARALPWAVARVAANGQVQYIPFEGLGTLAVPAPQNTITPPGPRARPSR